MLVRAVAEPLDAAAVEWVEAAIEGRIVARVPDVVFAETAHALLQYVRAGLMTADAAIDRLRYLLRLPLQVESLRLVAVAALGVAVVRGTSVLGAILVTTDRRLAGEADASALLPGTGPPA